ncbi:hypothetical protein As57867_017380, partial [Aphanomyces stellatus]
MRPRDNFSQRGRRTGKETPVRGSSVTTPQVIASIEWLSLQTTPAPVEVSRRAIASLSRLHDDQGSVDTLKLQVTTTTSSTPRLVLAPRTTANLSPVPSLARLAESQSATETTTPAPTSGQHTPLWPSTQLSRPTNQQLTITPAPPVTSSWPISRPPPNAPPTAPPLPQPQTTSNTVPTDTPPVDPWPPSTTAISMSPGFTTNAPWPHTTAATVAPSAMPTRPTPLPINPPSTAPFSNVPTASLSNVPTTSLSNVPTASLSNVPTVSHSNVPTASLSNVPTVSLSNVPTASPSQATGQSMPFTTMWPTVPTTPPLYFTTSISSAPPKGERLEGDTSASTPPTKDLGQSATNNSSSDAPTTNPIQDTNQSMAPRTTLYFDPQPQLNTSEPLVSPRYWAALVAALVCTVVLLGFIARRLRQRKFASTNSLTTTLSDGMLNWQGLQLHQINIDDICITKRLAAGAYGILYLATYQDQLVAVKTCTKTTLPDIQAFFDELALLATLTSPTIVTLVGVAWTKATDLKAVLEYMNMGDLRDVLAKTTSATLPWQAKLECALSVAKALVYL